MTQTEALQEARRRWGVNVFVQAVDMTTALKTTWHYYILERTPGLTTSIGSGNSWEAAFADADRREGAK